MVALGREHGHRVAPVHQGTAHREERVHVPGGTVGDDQEMLGHGILIGQKHC